jgi:NTP pyrophosphatase (non-canonical NTP hydrolase)
MRASESGSGNQVRCFRDDHEIYRQVLSAREAAHEKHKGSEFGSMERMPADRPMWLAILGEEFGEVCNALTYDGRTNLRAELIDVLAVASAWVAALDSEAAPEAPMFF